MLIVFDLDGTLVDSRRDIADSANDLIVLYGGAPLPETRIGQMVGDGAATLVRRALDAAGISPQPSDALRRFLEIYDTRLVAHTRPYDGMVDALVALAPFGPAAVLTNKPLAASRRILDALSLAPFFTNVIGGDGPFARKPDPAALRHLAELHRTPLCDTMLVGDSPIDCETAARAGTAMCLARYGFGYDRFRADSMEGTLLMVDSPAEIVDAVKRFADLRAAETAR